MPPFIINPAHGTPEFEDWPWDPANFYTRIRSLQQTIRRMKDAKVTDEEALLHDRKLHPLGATHYPDGRPIWKGSKAAESLEDDFKNDRHLNMTMKAFKATRPEYENFSETRIWHRLDYQPLPIHQRIWANTWTIQGQQTQETHPIRT